jgi:hypothetical protein
MVYLKAMFRKYQSTLGLGLIVAAALTTVVAFTPSVFAQSTTTATTTTVTATTTPIKVAWENQVAVEKRVRELFADAPVMIEIARCESKFRQFTDSGNLLRGGGSTGMIGVFQFYEAIHAAPALALGFNLATLEGNLGYARHLYTAEGTRPWASCVPAVIPATPVLTPAQMELKIKLLTQVVALLQELLKMELAKQKGN